jgi:hypothetical protein
VLTADAAALDAQVAASSVLAWLRRPSSDAIDLADADADADAGTGAGAGGADSVAVVAGERVRRVAPGLVGPDLAEPPRGRFVLWADDADRRPELEVRQGGRLLWRSRSLRPLVPDRPYDFSAGWVTDVEVPGPEVTVTLH